MVGPDQIVIPLKRRHIRPTQKSPDLAEKPVSPAVQKVAREALRFVEASVCFVAPSATAPSMRVLEMAKRFAAASAASVETSGMNLRALSRVLEGVMANKGRHVTRRTGPAGGRYDAFDGVGWKG